MPLKAESIVNTLTLPKQMIYFISSVFPILGQQKFKIIVFLSLYLSFSSSNKTFVLDTDVIILYRAADFARA